MKKTNKILTILGCAALGLAGIGVASTLSRAPAQTKASTIQANIWDFTAKTSSHTSYLDTWTYGSDCQITHGANNNGGWAYVRTGGKGATGGVTLTSSYQNTVASGDVYTQIKLAAANVSSGSGFTMDSITLTVASNADFSTVIDTVSGVTVATSMTWTPTAGVTWAKGSYYKLTFSATSTSTSNRGMDVQSVTFFKEGTEVFPDSIAVSLTSTTLSEVGAKTKATATVSPTTVTNPSITWSSSNENVAIVDADGNVTAIANGTANIIATSVSKTSVSGFASITVSGIAATSVYDKVITISQLGFGTSYTSDTIGLNGVAYKYADAMKNISDSTLLQLKASTGSFQNLTALPGGIKKITLVGNEEKDLPIVLNVGSTNSPSTTVSGTRTGSVTVFDVATAGSNLGYFKLTASTNAAYTRGIVIELTNADVEAARTWATNFLSATNVCDPTGAADNITSTIWTAQSDAFTNLSAAAKTALTDEDCLVTVTTIQQALARYKYIVNKYGAATHANFLGITITPAAVVGGLITPEKTGEVVTYTLGGITLLGAVAALFYFRKKKQA